MQNLKKGLNGNQLKLIAAIAMTLDHIGWAILPDLKIFNIIGRISFPIFAYLIAEGCFYTKNRVKYFLQIFILGLGCQVVYFIAEGDLYQNILITFSLSVLTIFCLENFWNRRNALSAALAMVELALVVFLCIILPNRLENFVIDYGIAGTLLPVAVYFVPKKIQKIIVTALMLMLSIFTWDKIQLYSLLSVIILMFYNGERGKMKLKYFFYIFYPVHLAVIYFISLVI